MNIEERTVPNRDGELEEQLAAHLDGASLGQPVYAFRRVGSAMDVAHQLAAEGAAEGTLVWAGSQERGRGRLGRVWASPEGGLYLSMVLRPSRPPGEIAQLSLVAGLSVAGAIQELTGLPLGVRWPNDLILDGKKIAGILTEVRGGVPRTGVLREPPEAGGRAEVRGGVPRTGVLREPPEAGGSGAVIVGIGVNVRAEPGELPETATSLAALGKPVDRRRVTGLLCRHLSRWYDVWHHEGFAPIREALRSRLALLGEMVHVQAGSDALEGTLQDLDESGRLLIRLDAGMVRAFDVGEVTHVR